MNNCNYIYAQFWKEEGEKGGIVIGDTDMLKKKEGVKRKFPKEIFGKMGASAAVQQVIHS